MRKQKMLNMQAQLEHLGVRIETISKLAFNYNKLESLGLEFLNALADLDAQQVCNRYVWEGLPENLSGMQIESMLYNKGSLAGFFLAGTLYIMPYAQRQGINAYGQSNSVAPVSYNGSVTISGDGLALISNNLGMINKNARAAILYDRIPTLAQNATPVARRALNKELIEFQCDLLGRIKNNLRNIDKKMVWYVDDEGQANQMRQDLREAYGTSDPFVVLVRKPSIDQNKDGQPMQGQVDSETQSLFETWQSVNSIRCMCSGITNGGAFEKKERKITGELQGDQTQTNLVLDAGLRMRNLFLDQMRFIYPEYAEILNKISVKINENNNAEYEMTEGQQFEGDKGDDNE